MKLLMLASAIVSAFASVASADTNTSPQPKLFLRPAMCQATNELVLYWARRSKGVASFAAATSITPLVADCSSRAQAKIGYSKGATSAIEADSMALASCNALNAGKSNIGPCIIVGRLQPQAVN